MNKTKICIGANSSLGIGIKEQIYLFKDNGFDAFFTVWDEKIKEYSKAARECGLIYQSVHASNRHTENMWESGLSAEIALNEWMNCVDACSENNIPIMVAHVFRGIGKEGNPSKAGLDNFTRIIDYAEEKGVNIAFENTEGERYLQAIFDAFAERKNVGFCWDTGHELCYNRGRDMISDFGRFIICTHLNDNLGVRSLDGSISSADDLHMLPFDGKNDWEDILKRLHSVGYNGILTFEVRKKCYPDMQVEKFIAEAYKRANKIRKMKDYYKEVDSSSSDIFSHDDCLI